MHHTCVVTCTGGSNPPPLQISERRRTAKGGLALPGVLPGLGPARARVAGWSRPCHRRTSRSRVLARAREELRGPGRQSAAGLVDEIVAMLGSPDTEWRNDFGYSVVARCVLQRPGARRRAAAVSGAAPRRQPAQRHRPVGGRLRAAALVLGARPVDPRRARQRGPVPGRGTTLGEIQR
jgi:hypothetical protein